MDYSAWKLFMDAAELGSLSKVAVAYGTTQPHISRQISELELECGGRLFQRTGRGVVLTELGQRIAPKVRAWLASTEQLANDVRTSAGTPIGKVRIASMPSAAHPLVNTLYKRLNEQYPLIQLAVREGQGNQLETWLEEGSVDLAILYRTNPSPKNGDTYLAETSTYLVSAAGDPLTSRATVPFSALHDRPLVCSAAQTAGAISWKRSVQSKGFRSTLSWKRLAEFADAHCRRGWHLRIVGTVRYRGRSKGMPPASVEAVRPVVHRYIALAISRHAQLTLACRTVMQVTRDIAKSSMAGLARI